MTDFFEALQIARDELEKAVHNGEQGKFRRNSGKTIFIRSKDKKVTKGPEDLKGSRLIVKDVTTVGMAADLGSPSAEVLLTDGVKKPKKKPQSFDAMVKSIDGLIDSLKSVSNPSPESGDKN